MLLINERRKIENKGNQKMVLEICCIHVRMSIIFILCLLVCLYHLNCFRSYTRLKNF